MTDSKSRTLSFIGGSGATTSARISNEGIYAHFTLGRILNLLSSHYDKIYWCTSVISQSASSHEQNCLLAKNIEIIETPYYASSMDSLGKAQKLKAAYEIAVSQGDDIFIRGMLPGIRAFYRACEKHGKRPLHWIVSNPVALLLSHRRGSWFKTILGLAYSKYWEYAAKRGSCRTRGAMICNGRELVDRMNGCRCYEVVSSTLSEDNFYLRDDTCLDEIVNITAVCFVRPEKGLQYLIEALSQLKTNRNIHLNCIGTTGRYADYEQKLHEIIKSCHLEDVVSFPGYFDQSEIFNQLKKSDIFVLPSLSEGTPRVIVESRACGVPTIATRVGGIPSSIEHEKDGLLVPVGDSQAIAECIDRIIENQEFRKQLIHDGYEKVRKFTVELFVEKVLDILDGFQKDI